MSWILLASSNDIPCSPKCTAPTLGDCIRDGRSCLNSDCPSCNGFGFDPDGTALRQVCRTCGGSGIRVPKVSDDKAEYSRAIDDLLNFGSQANPDCGKP